MMETEEVINTIHHQNGHDAHFGKHSGENQQIKNDEIESQKVRKDDVKNELGKENIENQDFLRENDNNKEIGNEVFEDQQIGKEVIENAGVEKYIIEHEQVREELIGNHHVGPEATEKEPSKNLNHVEKQGDPKVDKLDYPLETKTISGKELDIEVTRWPDGEIRKLKILESGNSVVLFYEEYDQLEDVESPVRDPSFIPELLESLDPLSPMRKASESAEFSLFQQYERKHKRLQRLQLEDDEGIVSKHATFFPAKIKRRDSKHLDVNSDHYYDMTSFPRGTITLLNVRNFRNSSGMKLYPRNGTDRDADGLCALFLELGFIVERYDNPTKKIMMSALEIAAAEEKLSCCACAILTHGDEGVLYATDQTVDVREITKLFRKKNLAGKPKLFIFQACQGSEYMDSIDPADAPVTTSLPFSDERNVTLPCEADFLYAYSTVPGYFSWRNSRQGSWFVQAVCSVFREHGHTMDVYKMFTRVNDKVASRSNTDNVDTDDKRQIASIVSQMRKDFFFFPPYGPLPLI